MLRENVLEKYLKVPWVDFVFNLILAGIIFGFAELGKLAGTQGAPLPISVIWPPTGIALATSLIFGFYRVWTGIFLGNILYNTLHLGFWQKGLTPTLMIAFVISAGSLLQTWLGNYFLRRFCSRNYFSTVRDIFIFLIFGGLLTCLTACTIGVFSLSLFESMSWERAIFTWLNFWVGDLMGVYVFTPIIAVWFFLSFPRNLTFRDLIDVSLQLLGFIAVTILIFLDYPLGHLYIPLSIWASYRFGMYGAILSIFLVALGLIVPTAFGYGLFNTLFPESNRYLVMITYLESLVATNLVLAAVISEREIAWQQIRHHNVDLQQAVEMHAEDLKEISSDLFIKERYASLGLLTSGIARQIQIPLQRINVFSKSCLDYISQAQNLLNHVKDRLSAELAFKFQNYFEIMSNYLFQIAKAETQATRVSKVIEEQAVLSSSPGRKMTNIHINTLFNNCLEKAVSEASKRYPGFHFTIQRDFDNAITMMLMQPEDLAHALYHLLMHAISSLKQQKDILGTSFDPILKATTKNLFAEVEIIIRDNGVGIPKQALEHFFSSFLKMYHGMPLMENEGIDLTITLAYDIITHIYHGEILADSKEGEYLQLTILLPKQMPHITKT